MSYDVVIVGGGVAGLSAAIECERASLSWCLLEADTQLGGRIKTTSIDGFLCDHGFQVLLPGYPTAKSLLDYSALELQYFPRGTQIKGDDVSWFGLPGIYPQKFQVGNKMKLGFLDYVNLAIDSLMGQYPKQEYQSKKNLRNYLEKTYTSHTYSEFLKPFFQGVFLDDTLAVSVSLYRYYLSLFLRYGSAIPKYGMQQIPLQLSNQLNAQHIRLSTKVTKVEHNHVYVSSSEKITFRHLVVATDIASVPIKNVDGSNQDTSVVSTTFFVADSVGGLAPLVFFPEATNCQQIAIPSLVSSAYAPAGKHLIMCSELQATPSSPKEIQKELNRFLAGQTSKWSYLYSHTAHMALPRPMKKPDSLSNQYEFCGDWTQFPSIEGAMKSGVLAVQQILKKDRSF